MSFAKSRTLLPLLLSLTSCNSATNSPTSDSPYGGTSASGSATAAGKGGTSVTGLGGLSSGGNPTAAGGTSGTVGSAGSVAATGGTSVTASQGGTNAMGSAGTTTTPATGGTPIAQGGTAVTSAGAGTAGRATGGSTGVVFSNAGAAGSTGTNACGITLLPSNLTPLYMVFLYDKSGSMGDSPAASWQNSATRWAPMTAGIVDFFTQTGTVGIQASLEFFPAPGGDIATICHADYKTPAVPITSLETPSPLVSALESATPGGSTPTLPAVMGGLAYAKQLMANDPGSKAVVVLVTDGEPAMYDSTTGTIETNCAPTNNPGNLTNTIADIASVVNAAYRSIPGVNTYVIGIGEAQADMAAIASAGGTQYVQLDATQPPETTRARLTEALQSIRTTQFQCSLPLPTSISFQKDRLNVSFKHSSGTVDGLVQAPSCATPGWYYDNAATPTEVMLCPATCSAIQSDATGSFQLEFGCPTRTN